MPDKVDVLIVGAGGTLLVRPDRFVAAEFAAETSEATVNQIRNLPT